MLNRGQVAALIGVSLILWIAATAYIHFLPNALLHPVRGAVGFVTTLPVAWLSVALTQWAGRLLPGQLLSGVGIVGAVAMMIDGVVLRWAPEAYGTNLDVMRLGAAWLLWGYGVSLGLAVLIAARQSASPARSRS